MIYNKNSQQDEKQLISILQLENIHWNKSHKSELLW